MVQVELTGSKNGFWQFQGKKTKGTIFEYQVRDMNFSPALKWSFQVRVPDKFSHGEYIDVRAVDHPQKEYWAGLDLKSVTFTKATQPNYLNFVYAKLFLSDVTGEKKQDRC